MTIPESIGTLRAGLAALIMMAVPARLAAQTSVTLPNSSSTTTLTAAVSEQARVTVPGAVTFNVTNVTASTGSGNLTVSIQNIVLATATKQFRISLRANAASFTPSVGGATTWLASDVTWSTPAGGPNAWVNATRANGTLSSASYGTVADCSPDAASCSTTGLSFTLGAKSTVKRSGVHTLVITWRFESIGT